VSRNGGTEYTRTMKRNILYIHIPAFPIAVARVRRPELRGRPVVVAIPHSERALVLCASPEARQARVYKGMPLGQARRRCPALVVCPPAPDLTARAFDALLAAAARYTPLWEPARPGHVYLDITGTGRLWGRAQDTARRLRREIGRGMDLTTAVGVAGNKMTARIASEILWSAGVCPVAPGREAAFLAPLRVDVVPGVGACRRLLLEELGIRRVRQLAVMDLAHLALVFGPAADLIRERARGIDPTPVYPPAREPVLRKDILLTPDEQDDDRLLGRLYQLVEQCAAQLRQRDVHPRQAGLLVRYADQTEATRRLRLPRPSFWEPDLFAPLAALLPQACQRRVRVRLLRVWFRDFAPPDPQLKLFAPPTPAADRVARAIRALDRIRGRYGDNSIRWGRAA